MRYELRSKDELDGLSRPARMEPRWTEYTWPKVPGLHKGFLDNDRRQACCRIDKGKTLHGWWQLDDLISVICGREDAHAGNSWKVMSAVDLIKVMAAFRMIGAEDRLEVCLPPEYKEVTDAWPRNIDEQISSAVVLSRGGQPHLPPQRREAADLEAI